MAPNKGLEIVIEWFKVDALGGSAIAVFCILARRDSDSFVHLKRCRNRVRST